MGSTGREEVANCVNYVLDYYVAQSTAPNHLVKEVPSLLNKYWNQSLWITLNLFVKSEAPVVN